MNNPTPPRSPELQAALDWHLPMDEYNLISTERRDAAILAWHNGDGELIIAAEVYRLEEQVRTLRTALGLKNEALLEIQANTYPEELFLHNLIEKALAITETALAQPSETKETK